MKIVNFMNFVRQYEPRAKDLEAAESRLFETTQKELFLAKEYGLENTFLLQYDVLLDEKYVNLFKTEADAHMELGLWYEIVKPLVEKAGLTWRGRLDWRWDWHIVPGFSMAYNKAERELLIDLAMEKFRDVFGYYPKTVASWLLDSHTVKYLVDKYHISAVAICREQRAIDAYTLIGGYFNQAYYPSKNNIYTPAQSEEYQINVPVFRLLGPDPIHCYDRRKHILNPEVSIVSQTFTMEPGGTTGADEKFVNWFFKNNFTNEDLGFSYAQLGQENSFGPRVIPHLRMQLEALKNYPDVKFMKMSDTGEWFKQQYPEKTPATSVSGLDDWASDNEVQSVYYDCCNYVANVFRCRDRIFLRALYLFDETVKDYYLDTPCDTWDAIYENLPLVDTLVWQDNKGLVLDQNGSPFSIKKAADQVLTVQWDNGSITFLEDKICIYNLKKLIYDFSESKAKRKVQNNTIIFEYKGTKYGIGFEGAVLFGQEQGCVIEALENEIVIRLKRYNLKQEARRRYT